MNFLGNGVEVPGLLSQGNPPTTASHYDNDEDGENTTS